MYTIVQAYYSYLMTSDGLIHHFHYVKSHTEDSASENLQFRSPPCAWRPRDFTGIPWCLSETQEQASTCFPTTPILLVKSMQGGNISTHQTLVDQHSELENHHLSIAKTADVDITIINHPSGNGLYQLFMVMTAG